MPTFNTANLSKKETYKLMTGAIVPRPIAWVSTISDDGVLNLAPFSFFNGVAVVPPTIGFSIGYDDSGFKDTYLNLQANGECVVNIVTEATARAMNETAKRLSPDVDEFEYAGVTPRASSIVTPPRVAESPLQFECKLSQIVTLQNDLGRSDLVLCEIVMIHIDDSIYAGDYKIDQVALQAVGRMGGSDYVSTRDLFDMTRHHSVPGTQDSN